MKTKQLQIAGLAALIVIVWGFAGYRWLNPPVMYLGEADNDAMELMLDMACPSLHATYNELHIDGHVEWNAAMELIAECDRRAKTAQFEQVLIKEFSKHYEE